jgi:hypothetical protein
MSSDAEILGGLNFFPGMEASSERALSLLNVVGSMHYAEDHNGSHEFRAAIMTFRSDANLPTAVRNRFGLKPMRGVRYKCEIVQHGTDVPALEFMQSYEMWSGPEWRTHVDVVDYKLRPNTSGFAGWYFVGAEEQKVGEYFQPDADESTQLGGFLDNWLRTV